MRFCTHVPEPPLSEVVDRFWYFDGLDVAYRRERVLPDGTMELVINLDDCRRKLFDRDSPDRFQTFHRAWLSGARSDSILIDVRPRSSMVGVHFRPGGLTPFLGMPADELAGQVTELDAVWGADADRLRVRLLEAGSPRSKFGVLEAVLRQRLRGPPALPAAVRHALARLAPGQSVPSMRAVADAVGFSHKHFIDLFRATVGLAPKKYARVLRFQKALAAIGEGGAVDWAGVAQEAGYFDQAHFVHDFRAFSGFTPSEYVRRRNGDPNHVPADDPSGVG